MLIPLGRHWRMSLKVPYNAAPDNGMHPTADTMALIFGNRPWRRVVPGVGRLPG